MNLLLKSQDEANVVDIPMLINIFNVHSPASNRRPLSPRVREHVLRWSVMNAGSRAVIGGDLNSSKQSLDDGFKHEHDIRYCHEADHLHGDLVIAKGLDADSMTCDIGSTSTVHRMCIVQVKMAPNCPRASGSVAKPAPKPSSSEACGSASKLSMGGRLSLENGDPEEREPLFFLGGAR